jgi:hypothetical protein
MAGNSKITIAYLFIVFLKIVKSGVLNGPLIVPVFSGDGHAFFFPRMRR